MDHDDDGETSYNTFVDDVAFEPTYSQALLTAAGRNVATLRPYIFTYGMPYSFSSSRQNTSLLIGLPQYWSIGVTSGDVGSEVADCDPQNIRNPLKNCGSFVDATSLECLQPSITELQSALETIPVSSADPSVDLVP